MYEESPRLGASPPSKQTGKSSDTPPRGSAAKSENGSRAEKGSSGLPDWIAQVDEMLGGGRTVPRFEDGSGGYTVPPGSEPPSGPRFPDESDLHPIFSHPDVAAYPHLSEEEILEIGLDERTTTEIIKEEYLAKSLCPKCGKPGFRRLSRGRSFCATCDVAANGVGDFSTQARVLQEPEANLTEEYAAKGRVVARKRALQKKSASVKKSTKKATVKKKK
jgi:uncharacterized Zn finger protein (UPF0148 family)